MTFKNTLLNREHNIGEIIMMDGINNFTNISKLHNVSGTKPANILSNSPPQQIFTRGDPPAYTTGLERNVVPEELRDKFDGIPNIVKYINYQQEYRFHKRYRLPDNRHQFR